MRRVWHHTCTTSRPRMPIARSGGGAEEGEDMKVKTNLKAGSSPTGDGSRYTGGGTTIIPPPTHK